MTDKERADKLSLALRVILEDQGATLQGVLEDLTNLEELSFLNEADRAKAGAVCEAVRILLQKKQPKFEPKIGLTVGAEKAAYRASLSYGKCLRGEIVDIDRQGQVVLVKGKWENAFDPDIVLWVDPADLCVPEAT